MMRKSLRLAALALISASAFAFPAPETASAQPGYGRVTAYSHYGNGSVTGAVRRRGNAYEVQLPGGFWEDCAGNCRETLRREHLDFWETLRDELDGGRD